LQYSWRFGLFDHSNLKTQDGEEIKILANGVINKNAGPDFLNSKIKIGDTVWAGKVEIHHKSGDWLKHSHEKDSAYDSVIMHVVYENGTVIKRTDGSIIPCLELKNRISTNFIENYEKLIQNDSWIPCESHIGKVDDITISNWLNRLLVERLEDKTSVIAALLKGNKNNLEETFYQLLANNFGFKVNGLPFELLAKSLPLTVIAKHKNNLKQIEALFFGVAGFLEQDHSDKYLLELKAEFNHLKLKFNLKPLDVSIWKFLRLRPSNFPTIRIAQFAELIHKSHHVLSYILECKDPKSITKLFETEASNYWNTHYHFNKESAKRIKKLGDTARTNIIINTVAPFLFHYGQIKQLENYKELAIGLLDSVPPENNHIIKNFENLGIKTRSGFDSQALIQLKSNYCAHKKCLQCSIGNKILNQSTKN
ncbi:MAG: DUF2851 family protein, partial [Bacteroidia bacterium]|nr:DUF2851 family protein [Bacteroidia bacterium]